MDAREELVRKVEAIDSAIEELEGELRGARAERATTLDELAMLGPAPEPIPEPTPEPAVEEPTPAPIPVVGPYRTVMVVPSVFGSGYLPFLVHLEHGTEAHLLPNPAQQSISACRRYYPWTRWEAVRPADDRRQVEMCADCVLAIT